MNTNNHTHERGAISGSMIAIIGLIVLVLGAGSFGIWAYMNYNEQKINVDGKIALAEAKAEKAQADKDAAEYFEKSKEPNALFVGPDDYGRLTFSYPKTWSVYVAKDISRGGTYEAYLNPVTVPPVSNVQRFALRVTIEEKDFNEVLKNYASLIKKGDIKSSAFSASGNNGTRFDGNFTKDIRGVAVVFKLRDKTVTVRTDADTFKPDYQKLIKTIDFNN